MLLLLTHTPSACSGGERTNAKEPPLGLLLNPAYALIGFNVLPTGKTCIRCQEKLGGKTVKKLWKQFNSTVENVILENYGKHRSTVGYADGAYWFIFWESKKLTR